ncbi:MAG: cupin domain-containing protein [Acidimicrobiia bacterium]
MEWPAIRTDADLEVEPHDVFAVMQLTRGTALGSLVGVDLVRVEAGCESGMHRHNRAETVLYFTAGSGEVLVHPDRTVIAVHAGDRLELPAGTFHAVRTRDDAVEFVSVQSPPILDVTTGVLDLEPIGDPRA